MESGSRGSVSALIFKTLDLNPRTSELLGFRCEETFAIELFDNLRFYFGLGSQCLQQLIFVMILFPDTTQFLNMLWPMEPFSPLWRNTWHCCQTVTVWGVCAKVLTFFENKVLPSCPWLADWWYWYFSYWAINLHFPQRGATESLTRWVGSPITS